MMFAGVLFFVNATLGVVMQDSNSNPSGLVQDSSGCIRCPETTVFDLQLCQTCHGAFQRYRREKGGSSRDYTVEDFIQQHPLRNTRRFQDRLIKALPDNELIPGFMVFGSVMAELVEEIRTVADSDISVFIQGKTGVGKELVAKAIHALSPRRRGPFVPVNSAAVPSQLAESEMFGHVRGSFTGANRNTDGFFRKADGGTLFLDEVVDMQIDTQSVLLRALQNGEVRSVGSANHKFVDVRVIAAANRNVGRMCKKGKFREDLYFRLAGIVLVVPSLKERKEEIPPLAQHLANKFAKRPVSIDGNVLSAFVDYPWPGNVRELEQVLQRGLLYAKGESIQAQHIPEYVLSGESVF